MSMPLMALVAVVTVWFAAGSIWNVRKGNATMKWMQGGLPLLGERTTVRWLGTTSVEMVISGAKKPFENANLVIFLEPRDVPWIWGPSRLRGRRDTLILRARLTRPPAADLEAVDQESWSGRDARRRISDERWTVGESTGTPGLTLFHKVDGTVAVAESLLGLARGAGMTVRRLSVRRGEPHLQLHVDLPLATAPAAEFFGAVRAIGERVLKP